MSEIRFVDFYEYKTVLYDWIDTKSEKALYLHDKIVAKTFPALNIHHQGFLTETLITLINWIWLKFGFQTQQSNIFWHQLTQNDNLDLKALLELTLPYIDDVDGSKRKKLRNLHDIYLQKDDTGYVYSNSQYNRCLIYYDTDTERDYVFARPYFEVYHIQNFRLLLNTIEACSMKLYVNWVDIVPLTLDNYASTPYFTETKKKINNVTNPIPLIEYWLDTAPGMSYRDYYNILSNHFYHEIKNCKWLLYDVLVNNRPESLIIHLEKIFVLETFWDNISWNQLSQSRQTHFENAWRNLLSSQYDIHQSIAYYIRQFFVRNHTTAQKLIQQGKLVLTSKEKQELLQDNDDDEIVETQQLDNEAVTRSMMNVPISEIYLFFLDQLTVFSGSWYYYAYQRIKKGTFTMPTSENLVMTLKNVYSYAKNLISFPYKKRYVQFPRLWTSLRLANRYTIINTVAPSPELSKPPQNLGPLFRDEISTVITRINNLPNAGNNWTKANWFNENRYLRRFYPGIETRLTLPAVNQELHGMVRSIIIEAVFESGIIHGIISQFTPQSMLTDHKKTGPDDKASSEIKARMKKMYFQPPMVTSFLDKAYHFTTRKPYSKLPKINGPRTTKSYFEYLTSPEQEWTSIYAMNWVSQIGFYHRYINCRVIYVTGSTGVGKSTQVPKLIMYSQLMLDYNSRGRTICTQPRIQPTIETAETISSQMGIAVRNWDRLYDRYVPSNFFQIQYKYRGDDHVLETSSKGFLRIVTDGTLLQMIKNNPFLTNSQPISASDATGKSMSFMRKFFADNLFDAVMIDESHEHNANMDMILTLMREVIYVNNSIRLFIVSATMLDDEPIYRRFYRIINDNRAYPLSAYITGCGLDRANIDRRIHISPPGATTRHEIRDHDPTPQQLRSITNKNYVEKAVEKTIKIVNTTQVGNILVFLPGVRDILKAQKDLNARIPNNVIAFGFYSELDDIMRKFVMKIGENLPLYTRYKSDIDLPENEIKRRLPAGTYTRVIIVATNIAEASITIANLRYIVDTGLSKINVYDAAYDVSRILTVPISKSSCQQRRGRVGRIASGDVYYLYDRQIVMQNRTPYQIANSKMSDLIMDFLIENARDSRIVSANNDINNRNNYQSFNHYNSDNPVFGEYYLWHIFENPEPIMEIIKHKYCGCPITDDFSEFYAYFGIDDTVMFRHVCGRLLNVPPNEDGLIQSQDTLLYYYLQSNFECLDITYDYKKYYTGYDSNFLQDSKLENYVIHPDENIFVRNPYTGKIIKLTTSPLVSETYFKLTLRYNKLPINVDLNSVAITNFISYKFKQAVSRATNQLLVVFYDAKSLDYTFSYTGRQYNLFSEFLRKYSIAINQNRVSTYVKSEFFINMSLIKQAIDSNLMGSNETLLWYCYTRPYRLSQDVLAITTIMKSAENLSELAKDDAFYSQNHDSYGDLHFIWHLWSELKLLLQSLNIDTRANSNILSQEFYSKKQMFINQMASGNQSKTISESDYVLFNKMYHHNELNSEHEFRYYQSRNKTTTLNLIDTNPKILNFLTRYQLKPTFIQTIQFIIKTQQEILSAIWCYQYDVKNDLLLDIQPDASQWIDQFMKFSPGVNIRALPSDNATLSANDSWLLVLDAYVRVFSHNLFVVRNQTYIKVPYSMIAFPQSISPGNSQEMTLLRNSDKSYLVIAHNITATNQNLTINYITPITLDWIIKVNPIYVYFLIRSHPRIKLIADPVTRSFMKKLRLNFKIQDVVSYINHIKDENLAHFLHQNLIKIDF